MKNHLLLLMICIPYSLHASHFFNNIHHYTWANYQAFSGNKEAAQKWYNHIFSSFGSVYSYKGYIHFLFQNNEYTKIVSIMEKLSSQFAQDPLIQKLYAISLQQIGNTAAADALFIALNIQFPLDHEIAFYTISSYLKRKEPENALLIIDSIINTAKHRPYEYVFHFLKAQTALSMNKPKDAKEEVKICLEINPRFEKGWLLLALLLEQEGDVLEAIKGFTAFLSLTKEPHKDIEQHLLNLLLRQKKITEQHSALLLHIHSFDSAAHYIYSLQQVCMIRDDNIIFTSLHRFAL